MGEMSVSWRKPPTTPVKINVDDASNVENRRAGVGCVIINHEWAWVRREALSVGQVGSLKSEIYAILFGLKQA